MGQGLYAEMNAAALIKTLDSPLEKAKNRCWAAYS
jgi:hypothetical protein